MTKFQKTIKVKKKFLCRSNKQNYDSKTFLKKIYKGKIQNQCISISFKFYFNHILNDLNQNIYVDLTYKTILVTFKGLINNIIYNNSKVF